MQAKRKVGRTFAYQTWNIARLAQEIRRLRPMVQPKPATEAAIRFMSAVYEAEGANPIPMEYFSRVKKALQTLENRNAVVNAFEFQEAWYVVHGLPSPVTEAAEEAIRCYIDA